MAIVALSAAAVAGRFVFASLTPGASHLEPALEAVAAKD